MKIQVVQNLFRIIFVIFLFLFLWICYYHLFGKGILRPVLACSEQVINLGEISSEKPFEYEVTITNTGVRPLIISNIRPGCAGCIDLLKVPQKPLKWNQSAKIRFALITESLHGATSKSFLITTNDPVTPLYVVIVNADVQNRPFP